METQRGFAEVNGTRLYYELAGEGEPVVLVHGFSLDTRMWDDQVDVLSERYRVLRYDARGFGKSALPTQESYAHADDLRALLDYLGIGRAVVVGLSLGGYIAITFTLAYPARTRGLVVAGTLLKSFRWSSDASARDGVVWQRAREVGVQAATEAWLNHPMFRVALSLSGVAPRLRQIVGEYSGWHFLNPNPERGLDPPAAQRLAEIAVPTLVIIGEHDVPDFQRNAELLSQQVPVVGKVVIEGAGHMTNMEVPALFNAALLGFLAGLLG